MDRSQEVTLITETSTQDAYGVWRTSETKTDVFCQVNSVGRNEFFEAGRNGLNPEFVFTLFFGDYNGERTVEYNGKRYSVYRTYLARTDVLELYVERKGGSNGKAVNGGDTGS